MDDEWDEELDGIRIGDPVLVTTDDSVVVGTLLQTGGLGIVVRVTHRAAVRVEQVPAEDVELIRAGVAELGWWDLVDYAVKRHGVRVWDLLRIRSKAELVSEVVCRVIEEKVEASERVVLAPLLSPITKFIPIDRVEEVADYAEWSEDNMLATLDWAIDVEKVR